MSDWCILRTSGRNTLPLAVSLAVADIEAWTPTINLNRRTSRARDRIEQLAPLTPTFVFARSRHLLDLIDLADARTKQQPDFSVFYYLGRIPLLADDDLNGLRISEARKVPRSRQRTYNLGETVRVTEGGFAGMSGVVEDGCGRYTLVCFGRMSVKISTFLLHPAREMAA